MIATRFWFAPRSSSQQRSTRSLTWLFGALPACVYDQQSLCVLASLPLPADQALEQLWSRRFLDERSMAYKMASSSLLLAALALLPSVSAQFQIGDLPNTWQTGQTGTNQCNDGNSQTSMCQTAHIVRPHVGTLLGSADPVLMWSTRTPSPTSVCGLRLSRTPRLRKQRRSRLLGESFSSAFRLPRLMPERVLQVHEARPRNSADTRRRDHQCSLCHHARLCAGTSLKKWLRSK